MKKIFIFLFLVLILLCCGCLNNENNTTIITNNSQFAINNSNGANISHNNNITVIKLKENNISNMKSNISENITNNFTQIKKYNFSKNIDIDKMFLNLNYTEEWKYEGLIIKKYCNDGLNVTFEVSLTPIDFSNAYIFNDVKKYLQKDIYGYYYYYEFIPKNKDLPVSYCYYRKVGNYYLIMQTNKVNNKVNELWTNWSKYVFSLFEVN
ncbi:conserved exported protein of unknown function [Methanocaldococcus lauensis]|uniref:Uncharacterized protein n=1 Tax=Methanocaldococcus lauensis TaxID=2546128 RepID=A0A8D6PZ30_9EURY|nr:hypothetical protein [Methanocaldococcus lauensis]CAB3289925.1 conserved exported protein of unknown function [Methanocaldococcus lauensis]